MAVRPLNGLSLCSGIGGLDLGVNLADPEYRTVCYVEREIYPAAVLRARMEDGFLASAPIWSDLDTFDGRRWRGAVDIITAGFPCPPVSLAGRRHGDEDERWLWPRVAEIVRDVEPEWVFIENVYGLLSIHAGREFGEILGDLADLGFDASWEVLSASDLGASHLRNRVFILGHARNMGLSGLNGRGAGQEPQNGRTQLADAQGPVRQQSGKARNGREGLADGSGQLGDTDNSGLEGRAERAEPMGEEGGELPPWPPGRNEMLKWAVILERHPELAPRISESRVRRIFDGPSVRVDRLRALGNAVVPVVAAKAFITLARRFGWIISR